MLTPFDGALQVAVRRGLVGANPCRGLLSHERPKKARRKMRTLSSEEIPVLLEAVPKRYREPVRTAIFTGMRIGELVELRWSDVDFAAGVVRVRSGKTEAAAREIVLMPALGKRLREHKLASDHSGDDDYVFGTVVGTQTSVRNLQRRGLQRALEDSGVEHCRFHDLRHTFASILVGQGLDVTFVADQLGHSDPAITLRVYAKLFDPKRRRDEARARLEAAFGGMV